MACKIEFRIATVIVVVTIILCPLAFGRSAEEKEFEFDTKWGMDDNNPGITVKY